MSCRICAPTPGELLAALRKGEEQAALETLEQWLDGNPDPLSSCPIKALELVVDLVRVECEAGADPAAVANEGLEVLRLLLERLPGGEVREPLREATRHGAALVHGGSRVSEDIRRAVAYLHTHYTSPSLNRAKVAQEARLCPSCFSQRFHEEMGVTYEDYLRDLRIEEAQRRLTSTSHSLQKIAQEVGYETSTSLWRAFKKGLRVTPGQYRRQLGEKSESP